MAQFPGMRLTVEGNKMILRSASGRESEQLKVTKAVLGDGQVTGNIDKLTSLVSPKLEVTISDEEIKDDTCIYHFLFDNKRVNQGFYWREIGLYGKNGNSGEEKLIAYSNANGLTSYIQDKTQPIPMQRLKIVLAVGDNSNVKAVIDVSNAVDLDRVLKEINKHNSAEDAHPQILEIIKFLKGTSSAETRLAKNLLELINLVGMGGIVAAKLDPNAGFIKFANGFTIQWIWSTVYGATEMTYPVAFRQWCIPTFVHRGNDSTVNVIERYDSDLTTLRLSFNHPTSNEFKAIIVGV